MTNPVRTCIGCEQADDHPRHVIAAPDGSTIGWHMDCHATVAECPVCRAQIAGARAAKGDRLREHLLTTGPGPDQPGWTAPTTEATQGMGTR